MKLRMLEGRTNKRTFLYQKGWNTLASSNVGFEIAQHKSCCSAGLQGCRRHLPPHCVVLCSTCGSAWVKLVRCPPSPEVTIKPALEEAKKKDNKCWRTSRVTEANRQSHSSGSSRLIKRRRPEISYRLLSHLVQTLLFGSSPVTNKSKEFIPYQGV
jgi:hypothetical protein